MPTPNPDGYPTGELAEQLDAKLRAAGVTSFSAAELLTLPKALPRPRLATIAEMDADGYGVETVLNNLTAVAKVAQAIRDEWGSPIVIRSAYRPAWYNKIVSGSDGSQHVQGRALDMTPLASADHKAFQRLVVRLWDEGLFNGLGIYLYGGRVHVDTRSRKTTWTLDRVKALRK